MDSLKRKDTIECIEINMDCGGGICKKECVIRTQKEFNECCINWFFPKIDFEKFTLLGISAGTSGCKPPIIEGFLTKDESLKVYNFLLEIHQIGGCKPLFPVAKWYLVPKIDNDFNVNFKVNTVIKNN